MRHRWKEAEAEKRAEEAVTAVADSEPRTREERGDEKQVSGEPPRRQKQQVQPEALQQVRRHRGGARERENSRKAIERKPHPERELVRARKRKTAAKI